MALTFSSFAAIDNKVNYQFKHLLHNEKQNIGAITRILEDKNGFMWFSGEAGVARYDSQSFDFFFADRSKKNTLSSNYVLDMVIDNEGLLWAATDGGLNKYNPLLDVFQSASEFAPDLKLLSSLRINSLAVSKKNKNIYIGATDGVFIYDEKNNTIKKIGDQHKGLVQVNSVYIDKLDRLWAATAGHGLALYNPSTSHFRFWQNNKEDKKSISSNNLQNIFQDTKGNIWVSTFDAGISRLSTDLQDIKRYQHKIDDKNSLCNNTVSMGYQDRQGRIRFAIDHGGICEYNAAQDNFLQIDGNHNRSNIKSDQIKHIFSDSNDDIWVGFYPAGIAYWNSKQTTFTQFFHVHNNDKTIADDGILSFMQTQNEDIWIGTEKGISILPLSQSQEKKPFTSFNKKHKIKPFPALGFIEEQDGHIWIGTWNNGLHKFNPHTNKITSYLSSAENNKGLIADIMWDFAIDSTSTLWIGTQNHGLVRYNKDNDTFTHLMHDKNNINSLSNNYVWDVIEEKPGYLLIATSWGLDRYDIEKNHFEHLETPLITQHSINVLYKIQNGDIWIGTRSNGLIIMNKKGQFISKITTAEGLASLNIASIVQDQFNQIWVTTNLGVSKIDPNSKHIQNYRQSDGLTTNLFNRNATLVDNKGDIYLGGSKGISLTTPKIIQNTNTNVPIYINDLKLFNQAVPIGEEDSVLSQAMLYTKHLTLENDHDMITFGFTALNYKSPTKTQYSYKLDGFDKDWNDIGKEQNAIYTNLDARDYTFRVKVSTQDNKWQDRQAQVKLTILPSIWQTWYAKITYLGGCFIIIYTFVYLKLLRKARVNAERTASAKSDFLATMSHEIRTPLAGIIGMQKLVFKDTTLSPTCTERLTMAQMNAESLLNITNDILDLSKIEANKLVIENISFDIRELLNKFSTEYKIQADKKGIAFNLNVDNSVPKYIQGDPKRLLQILSNFVSNAIKFTEQGFVNIKLKSNTIDNDSDSIENHHQLFVVVSDTGIGIPKEALKRLFNHFEQVDTSTTRKFEGAGLGLSLCKHLLDLMKGTIRIESEEDIGSHFHFSLPYSIGDKDEYHCHLGSDETSPKSKHQYKLNILCAEDVKANQLFIRAIVEEMGHYVDFANDGIETLNKLAHNNFDLILMDGRMPKMGGIEATQLIRQGHWQELNFSQPDIPIFALTATSDQDEKNKFIDAGMSKFISKPIKEQELYKALSDSIEDLLKQGKQLPPLLTTSSADLDALFSISKP